MTREEYFSEIDDLAGLDLTEAEKVRLIREARIKLLCDSDYRRANVEVGPTTADGELYDVPAGLYRVLKVKLDGHPCFPTDEETIDLFKTDSGSAYNLPSGSAFHYLTNDEDGNFQLGIYPAPTEAGLSIVARIVQEPDDLPSTGEDPDVPKSFQRHVIDYVAAIAYGAKEDSKADRDSYMLDFSSGVEGLRRLRNSMSGRGPKQAKVVRYHTV